MFCQPNVTIHDIWINKGINPCFYDVVSVNIYGDFLLLFGLAQWARYAKSPPIPVHSRPSSVLFWLQVTFSIFMPLLAVIRFCLQATVIGYGNVYGYMIVYLGWNVFCWPLSVILLLFERTKKLSNREVRRRHSYLLLIFWALVFVVENIAIVSYNSTDWWFKLRSTSDKLELSFFILRYLLTAYLFIVGFFAPGIPREYGEVLLNGQAREEPQTHSEGSTWRGFWKKIRLLLPFMWPRQSLGLQFVVLFCIILLILGRVTNVVVPIYYKLIVNQLGGDGQPPRFCWDLILVYVFIKFVQGGGTGGMGLLNNVRSLLWISVQQYTTREVQVQLFAHLHSLSLRWHLSRKTGEVIRIMDRGTNSVNQLLSYIVFSIMPTVADIIIAVVFFSTAFNIWFGVIVFLTMAAYLACTIMVTEWRTKYRRSMNLSDNALKTKSVDSLLNYETVKYYAGEQFETDRYKECILDYQTRLKLLHRGAIHHLRRKSIPEAKDAREEWKSTASLCLLNTIQNVIINSGLLVGSLVCAWMVSKRDLTVGDYVLFSSYIIQLYTPLNWFGTYYRMIQQSFIDTENMFDLLDEKQEVVDKEYAEMLTLPQGKIEFRDVEFHYSPEKPILKKISFTVNPGKTIAIVGSSGAGKSTIMRLLFRFFDVTAGQILVDDKDIRDYTQASLRQAIGVVPQDTVLFNETVMYNIRYGKVLATDEEVKAAAMSAEIHQSIISFPDQYNTMVGERGLKLSGGEKQRVAIARTLLKAPSFVLLDEATSALDTQTERNIQNALLRICANRTTVIIAHRLSTVIHADTILVLQDGAIVEKGRHCDLLLQNGLYSGMWYQQQENLKQAEGEGSEAGGTKSQ